MLDFFKSTHPTARKDYKCDLCNQIIHRGEVYHRYTGKYDGELFDDKYHLLCQNIINTYCSETGDNEYDNDSVYEWLHDNHCYSCDNNDECNKSVLICPLIRKHYERGLNL